MRFMRKMAKAERERKSACERAGGVRKGEALNKMMRSFGYKKAKVADDTGQANGPQ